MPSLTRIRTRSETIAAGRLADAIAELAGREAMDPRWLREFARAVILAGVEAVYGGREHPEEAVELIIGGEA
mgnify:CR=1 FL=1